VSDARNVNNGAREFGEPQIRDGDDELRVDVVAWREECGIRSARDLPTTGC
jgi:hypothetical protein